MPPFCTAYYWLLLHALPLRQLAGAQTPSPSVSSSVSGFDTGAVSCNMGLFFSIRSIWASPEEPCHQKLPFDLWILMQSEGTAKDADAKHVAEECIQLRDVDMLELITPEGWDPSTLEGAQGEVVSETKHTATFAYRSPLDFEAFCANDDITRVSRVEAMTNLGTGSRSIRSRRLKETLSEAGAVHKVEKLVTGLENLGCSRTRGEGQNLCVMSDSFNRFGQAQELQASGDLPSTVDVVKAERRLRLSLDGQSGYTMVRIEVDGLSFVRADELTRTPQDGDFVELPEHDTTFLDEGSAMMEVAFDIASGANFKFNTANIGEGAFADDIGTLISEEECDVIVEDIHYQYAPAFRDGPVADAVDEAVEAGTLYFTSAGNSGPGMLFASDFECTTELSEFPVGECSAGIAAHVFNSAENGVDRYRFPIQPGSLADNTTFLLQWDDDDFSARTIAFYIYAENVETGEVTFNKGENVPGRATASCFIPNTTEFAYYLAITQLDSLVEPVAMRLFSFNNEAFFAESAFGGSIYGHKCAKKAISVAAMDWHVASGPDGSFADPETSSVTSYSSRGPCIVDSGDGLQTRDHPVTTAATGLQTSTAGFTVFSGTSASATVAAAIATLIRAACYDEKVVGYSEMMEMLTNYEYTIDVTSDASGAAETFGTEAGFGIIHAEQVLGWIASNCQQACPGAIQPSPALAATPTPSAVPTVIPAHSSAPGAKPVPSSAPVDPSAPLTAPVAIPAASTAPIFTPAPLPALVATPSSSTGPVATTAPSNSPVATPSPSIAPFTTPAPSTAPVATPAPSAAPVVTSLVPPLLGSTGAPSRTPAAVTPASLAPSEMCTNGVRGVDGYGHCCALECGVCGGKDCRKRAEEVGLEAADCCVQRISESGVYCSDSGTAPCIMDPVQPQTSPCGNGLRGIEGYGYCCVLECGMCGGINCAKRAMSVGLEAAGCCVKYINESGVYCDESGNAPCIINND